MEVRGVRVEKTARNKKDSGLFVMKPPEFFSVPLLASTGEKPIRVVKVGDIVKEGTLIAKPNGRYGSFVYSPTNGKVIGIVKKLNAHGVECEHVVISRSLEDEEPETLKPLTEADYTKEELLKRLYESGIIDNFEPFDPGYKKYILKCPITTLIINCTEDEPYRSCDRALIENYASEVLEGAKLLKKVAGASEIEFIFTLRQWRLVGEFGKYLKKIGEDKAVKVKTYPNVYPLHYSRLIAYYETGKMVYDGMRTATTSVIVDSPMNCYDFFMAVTKGLVCTQRVVSVWGNNTLRKANYFIKNGTPIKHILDVVGTRQEYVDNMLIYGGIMSGIAQETLDISAGLTAEEILFANREEYSIDNESPCINCGKCVAVCPVRLHVKNIDEAVCEHRLSQTKDLGVEACLGCGACSYVCPAKRNLAQRVAYAKDIVEGKRGKRPASSEYEIVEGEDLPSLVVHYEPMPKHPKPTGKVPTIEDMLKTLDEEEGAEKVRKAEIKKVVKVDIKPEDTKTKEKEKEPEVKENPPKEEKKPEEKKPEEKKVKEVKKENKPQNKGEKISLEEINRVKQQIKEGQTDGQ